MDGAAHQGVPRLFCTYYQLRNLLFKWFSIEEYAPCPTSPTVPGAHTVQTALFCVLQEFTCVCVHIVILSRNKSKLMLLIWWTQHSKYICDLFKWHSSTKGWLLRGSPCSFWFYVCVYCFLLLFLYFIQPWREAWEPEGPECKARKGC